MTNDNRAKSEDSGLSLEIVYSIFCWPRMASKCKNTTRTTAVPMTTKRHVLYGRRVEDFWDDTDTIFSHVDRVRRQGRRNNSARSTRSSTRVAVFGPSRSLLDYLRSRVARNLFHVDKRSPSVCFPDSVRSRSINRRCQYRTRDVPTA
jgi:hypothetical protein